MDDDRPLRQGDVFLATSEHVDVWSRRGIIVTADCDIAHGKHRDIISFVPVIAATDYLHLFTLPSLLRKATKPVEDESLASMRRAQSDVNAGAKPISTEAAREWVARAPPAEIVEDLRVRDAREKEHLTSLLSSWGAACRAANPGTFAEMMRGVVYLRARTVKNTDIETIYRKLWADLHTALGSLPGDAFFINDLDDGHADDHGFVAYLRLVREIRPAEIAIRQADFADTQVRARRVSHLQSPYIYRITQQLADVFCAIGLPKEYEERRAGTMSLLADRHRAGVSGGEEWA